MSTQKMILAAGLVVCSVSNGLVAFSYAGDLLAAILAAVGASIPVLILWWWASAKSGSTSEHSLVFATVLLSVVLGAAFFLQRAVAIGTFEPTMSMFPLAAPALFFVVVFLLILLCTLVSFFLTDDTRHDET